MEQTKIHMGPCKDDLKRDNMPKHIHIDVSRNVEWNVCMYIVFNSCTCYVDVDRTISIIHCIGFSVIPSNITDNSNN